ncbi:27565_t:CDS:1, partial [Gigaspora margarita]
VTKLIEQPFDYKVNVNDYLPDYDEDDMSKNNTDKYNIIVNKWD